MALRKATADSEAGVPLSPEQQADMLEDAARRATSRMATVEAAEVDLRELEG